MAALFDGLVVLGYRLLRKIRSAICSSRAGSPVDLARARQSETGGRRWYHFPAMFGGLIGLLFVVVVWQFGSIANAIGFLQGYSVLPEQPTVSAGEVVPGQMVTVAFRLRNLTGGEVRVLGVQSGCSCVANDDLPLTLRPNSVSEMHVSFTPRRGDVGHNLRHLVTLYLSVDSPPVVLAAEATVVDNPEDPATVASSDS